MRNYFNLALIIVAGFFFFNTLDALATNDEPEQIYELGEPLYYENEFLETARKFKDVPYTYGNPTSAEQAHLEAINRARMNPQAEANRLLAGNLNEGIDSDFISTDPKQPLTFNARLYEAARLHSQDMVAQDYFSHTSADGQGVSDRITATGYQYWTWGENIAYSSSTAPVDEVKEVVDFHDLFVIDAGVTGRGHRTNIFEENFREVGIGTAHGNYKGYDYSWFVTCDFGTSQNSDAFVLGVVYDDQNGDNLYTAGEGIGNVEITVVDSSGQSTNQTFTASAGGYGIPLPPGNYTIHATFADGSSDERSLNIDNQNIKIDFLLTTSSEPPPPPPSSETVPVYRFYSEQLKKHFFTRDTNEKDTIIATFPVDVWRYEGIVWRVF